METDNPHEELQTERARAGETPHIARYILMFSTAAVVVVFVAMLIIWG
jgi:hypothetical protein